MQHYKNWKYLIFVRCSHEKSVIVLHCSQCYYESKNSLSQYIEVVVKCIGVIKVVVIASIGFSTYVYQYQYHY